MTPTTWIRAFTAIAGAAGLAAFAPAPAPGAFQVLIAPQHMDQAAGRGAVDITLRRRAPRC
jgi:hypothetical protein